MSHGRSVIEAQALASLRDRIVRDMRYPAGAWSDSDGCATSEPTKAPKRCLSNVVLPLMNDPSYGIRGNDFTGQVEVAGAAVTDAAESEIALALEAVYNLTVPTSLVSEGLRLVASQVRYHPVQDYLHALRWDGVPRIDDWLQVYLGASQVPRGVSARFLLGCVRRILEPGCKMDTTLILVGEQGVGKSSAMRALMPDVAWFSDTPIDLRSKDAYLAMQGVWVYEISELSAWRARDAESIKAFLSAQVDRFRPPYGRNMVTLPRQSVFVGTTNEAEFLDDPTGSRRFWPVRVGDCDLESLEHDRDQLWAEATVRVKRGEQHWLDRSEVAELVQAQGEYQRRDPWEEPVEAYVALRDEVTAGEVLTEALSLDNAAQHRGASMRLAGLLRSLGWRKKRVRRQGQQARVWVRDS